MNKIDLPSADPDGTAVEVADRAYVLDDGRVVYEGAAAEFAKDEERVRALAGERAGWREFSDTVGRFLGTDQPPAPA